MKIRKVFQGQVPENKIMSEYSTSQTDTYSCDYINNNTSFAQLYYQNTSTAGGKWSYISPAVSSGFAVGDGIRYDINDRSIYVSKGSYVRISLDMCFASNSYNYQSDIMIFCDGAWYGFKQLASGTEYHISNLILPINTTGGREVRIMMGKYTADSANNLITLDNQMNHFTVEIIR